MSRTDADARRRSKARRQIKTEEEAREYRIDQMRYVTPAPRYERDPAVLARNLRGLAELTGQPPPQVAAEIGVAWRWFRRLLAQGVARIDRRTRPSLELVAGFFRLGDVEELWNPQLPHLKVPAGGMPDLESWRQKPDWPYARKLLELLEGGQHGYLRGLLDSLHRLASQEGLASPTAYFSEPDPADDEDLEHHRQRRLR